MAQIGLSPKGRSATVVVASSTSRKRFNADLICDGVDDQDTINLAYSYLPAAGGKVLLLEGQFNPGSRINPVANSWIGGMGPGTVVKTPAAKYSLLTADHSIGETSISVADGSQFKSGMDCTIFDDDHQTPGAPGNGMCVRVTSVDGNTVNFVKTYGSDVALTTAKNARLFSSFSNFHIANVSDVRISDMTIDGNFDNNYAGNGDAYQNGISIGDVDGGYLGYTQRVTINDCSILNHRCGGIISWANAKHCTGAKIIRNYIYNGGYKQPIHFHGMAGSVISHNVFASAPGSTVGTVYLYNAPNNVLSDNVANCVITGYGYAVIGVSPGVSIHGDRILTPYSGIITDTTMQIDISGVLISGYDGGYGIDVQGDVKITGSTITSGTVSPNRSVDVRSGTGKLRMINCDVSYLCSTPRSTMLLESGILRGYIIGSKIKNVASTAPVLDQSGVMEISKNEIISAVSPSIVFAVGSNVRDNIGYIAPGEIRTVGRSITTLTQDAFNSLDNPFGQNVALLSLDIYVSTGATATSPNIDCGIGSSATADYTNLFDDLPGETIGLYNSKIATPGTQTQPVLWQTGAGNRYLNMSIKDAAATGMVATYVATVMGL